MLFNSITYLLFLPLVVAVYWLLPQRGRLWLILASSLTFYGFWRVEFIPLILFSAGLDYGLGLMIERSAGPVRKRLMIASVVINLMILGIFKYLIFFTEAAGSLARLAGYEPSWPELHIILPLGISFYIFATISYVVDVYRRVIPAEKSPLVYFCFVTFFPHLVAGPILRAGVLIPQLVRRAPLDGARMAVGVRRIIMGLFLKVCLADNVATLVDRAFSGDLAARSGADAWTMAFLFGFQIYFDFAAYSHIAIGSAALMGIVLPENFNFPYFAGSPRDFWRRWHISLSTWVRDYLYLPLIGAAPKGEGWDALPASREGRADEGRRSRALFITWTLMGFWHGANWTFGLWGLYHAACIWLERLINSWVPAVRRLPRGSGWLVTLPLMMAAWIPFRAADVSDALALWGKMIDPRGFAGRTLWTNSYLTAAAVLGGMIVVYGAYRLVVPRLARRPMVMAGAETVFFAVLIAFVFIFLQVRDPFIYFQF